MENEALTSIYERMSNIAAFMGEDGLDRLAGQAGIMLIAIVGLFVVMTEIWLISVKRRKDIYKQGQVPPFMIRFWSIFLLFPVYGLATRLLGLDIWYGALGNPYPSVAVLATTQIQFPENAAVVDQNAIVEGFQIYMSGYAGQVLLPALIACFFAWRIGLYGMALSKVHKHKNTGQIFLMLSGLLAIMFLPSVFDSAMWSAFFGNPDELADRLYTPITQETSQ